MFYKNVTFLKDVSLYKILYYEMYFFYCYSYSFIFLR